MLSQTPELTPRPVLVSHSHVASNQELSPGWRWGKEGDKTLGITFRGVLREKGGGREDHCIGLVGKMDGKCFQQQTSPNPWDQEYPISVAQRGSADTICCDENYSRLSPAELSYGLSRPRSVPRPVKVQTHLLMFKPFSVARSRGTASPQLKETCQHSCQPPPPGDKQAAAPAIMAQSTESLFSPRVLGEFLSREKEVWSLG